MIGEPDGGAAVPPVPLPGGRAASRAMGSARAFTKIVAVPNTAVLVDGVWHTGDGEEIGPGIFGAWAKGLCDLVRPVPSRKPALRPGRKSLQNTAILTSFSKTNGASAVSTRWKEGRMR